MATSWRQHEAKLSLQQRSGGGGSTSNSRPVDCAHGCHFPDITLWEGSSNAEKSLYCTGDLTNCLNQLGHVWRLKMFNSYGQTTANACLIHLKELDGAGKDGAWSIQWKFPAWIQSNAAFSKISSMSNAAPKMNSSMIFWLLWPTIFGTEKVTSYWQRTRHLNKFYILSAGATCSFLLVQ